MDFTVEYVSLSDETMPQRDGSFVNQKVARFYIGKFGPFVERFPADTFSDTALLERVAKLRAQLEALHR